MWRIATNFLNAIFGPVEPTDVAVDRSADVEENETIGDGARAAWQL